MSNDRGTIKWTSLMLPEHVELLKEMWQEDRNTEKPMLDSQQIEKLNEQLLEALERQTTVTLSIYSNGEICAQHGIITKLNSNAGHVILYSVNDTKLTIPFQDVLAVSI